MEDRAVNFDQLKDDVARRFPDLSRQLQRIARFSLDHPQAIALDTVAAAAAKVGVQPSAMVRFAQAFGYSGYSEMQRIFRDRLLERSSSYRERIEGLRRGKGRREERPAAVLREFVADSVANLNHLEEHVESALLEKAVRLLASAERNRPRRHGGMLHEQARGIGPRDVLIAVSFRNYSPDVIALAADCHHRHVPVVVITDSPMSPLHGAASLAFDLGDHSDRPFRSLVEPMCLALALVVSVGYQTAGRNARKSAGRRRAARID
jgi:DNA-binding MurR/RpiR family transcriptional regulator